MGGGFEVSGKWFWSFGKEVWKLEILSFGSEVLKIRERSFEVSGNMFRSFGKVVWKMQEERVCSFRKEVLNARKVIFEVLEKEVLKFLGVGFKVSRKRF